MSTHRNAPLTPEGRKRLCERIDEGRPISHVARDANVSRAALSRWYARWVADGEAGLQDRSSRPGSSPNQTPDYIEDMILDVRKAQKWGAARISAWLATAGVEVAPATVHRVLVRNNMSRLRDMDRQTGEQMREPVVRYEHDHPGDMIHVDIKKVGKIPTGGGWRAHGQGSEQHKASKRKGPGTGRIGYTYIHSAVDDHSRVAYSEALTDEKAETAAAFWHRAVAFFAVIGIPTIRRCLTDNGSCYRSRVWAAALAETGTVHKRTRPYTPKTNGKVERYNGILVAEWTTKRIYTSEADRTAALADFLNYYNHERPHSALGWKPPISRITGGSDHRVEPQAPTLPETPQEERDGQEPLW